MSVKDRIPELQGLAVQGSNRGQRGLWHQSIHVRPTASFSEARVAMSRQLVHPILCLMEVASFCSQGNTQMAEWLHTQAKNWQHPWAISVNQWACITNSVWELRSQEHLTFCIWSYHCGNYFLSNEIHNLITWEERLGTFMEHTVDQIYHTPPSSGSASICHTSLPCLGIFHISTFLHTHL